MWLMLTWLISAVDVTCSRPWAIPLADRCTRNVRNGSDVFFFFNVTVCMEARGRKNYCAQRDSGSEMGMYQVECG